MIKIPLLKLNSGTSMPTIGFGTWQLSDGRQVMESVTAALKTGYRLIDTAKIYGNERGVGEAIATSDVPREEIFITTKLWPGDHGHHRARDAFDGSLERLGLDYIDLYLIHWPGEKDNLRRESWEVLTSIYNEGLSKSVGVSNYEVRHLQEIMNDAALAPAVNQIEFHPFVYEEQKPTLEFCKANGIVVEAYSPLGVGRLIDHPEISAVAKKVGKSSAQVLIRWAFQHGTVPIPRSRNPEHVKSNFKIFDFELNQKDMDTLNRLS